MAQRGRPKKVQPTVAQSNETVSVTPSPSKGSDFDVVMLSNADDNTQVVTSVADLADKKIEELMRLAVAQYDPKNSQFSASLNIAQTQSELTVDRINELAVGAQNDLTKTIEIIGIIKQYINKSDLIGPVFDALQRNTNTEYKVTYPDYSENRNKSKQVKKAETVIDDFNRQINIEAIIRDAIPMTYAEGTYIMYLRQKDTNWIVDYYPMGVAEISDYSVDGNPVVLINISKLTDALSSTMLLDRRRKPLFFKDVAEVIENNYPEEVALAYKNRDTYAKLDVNRTGVIRLNNMGGKYGLSPIFRALNDAIYLDNLDNADMISNKAKAKKIIWQKLDAKLMGDNGEKLGYQEMIYAHSNLMQAWRLPVVVATTPPYVEKIEYVEPSVDLSNSEKAKDYRTRIYSTLGLSFQDVVGVSGVSTIRTSLSQMLKVIDAEAEQLERIMERFYLVVLDANSIGREFLPTVDILNSELLDLDLRKSMAQFLFMQLGSSYKTAYEMVSMDIDSEVERREFENENGYDTIFAPRITANTASGASSGGSNSSGGSGGTGDGVTEGTGGRELIDDPVQGQDKQLLDQERHSDLKNL